MNIKKYIILLTTLFFIKTIAQPDGYWDKDRTTNKQIVVSARKKVIIKSEDFPTGTTEVIYRITLLDENQELSGSLVSVLKSIPDPTGISQGSAGAVLLLSKIAGSDKCTYAIFNNGNNAVGYQKNGNIAKACLVQSQSINKDAKLLSLNKTICLKPETQNIWFGFESKNWVVNQKIILEIVPWIDNKQSRGWNSTNKKNAVQQIKKLELEIQPINKDLWTLSLLDKIQKNYTFSEFTTFETLEKAKITNDFAAQILQEISDKDPLLKIFRNDAAIFFKQKKLDQAISLLESTLLVRKKVNAQDLNQVGFYFLISKQFQKAKQTFQKAETIDNANLAVQLNMAHTELFLGNFSQAKTIYKKYQYQNINTKTSWKQQIKQDFDDFEKAGLSSPDLERMIKKLD